MAEDSNDTQQQNDDFEFEGQEQESTVQVAPQIFNGNGSHQPETVTVSQSAQSRVNPNIIGEKVVRSYTIPRTLPQINQDFMMRTVNQRPAGQDTAKIKGDREFLDALMVKPEAANFKVAIHRILPTQIDGDELPKGKLSDDTPLCFYDDLRNEIIEAWGGGKYRCVVVDEQGRCVPGIAQSVLVEISTIQYKPKFVKYEQVEMLRSGKGANSVINLEDEDIVRERAEEKKAKERERMENERYAREMREKTQSIQRLMKEKELARLMREASGSEEQAKNDPRVDIMMAKIEEDRRRYEDEKKRQEEERRRLDDERKEEKRRHEEELKEERRRNEDALKEAARQREEDRRRFEETQAKLFEKLADKPKDDGIMPVLLAMINRQPPPDKAPELFMEMNRQTTAVLQSALAPKPVDNSQMDKIFQLMLKDDPEKTAMMNSLMQAAFHKKEDLTLDKMMQLLKMGKDEAKEYFQLAQGMSVGKDGEPTEDDYDPALGVMGNVTKGIFSGLKTLAGMAMQSPELQQVLLALVGKKNPDDAALANAARMMESQGYTPQQMFMGPQATQQLPFQPQQQPYNAHTMYPPVQQQLQPNAFPPMPGRNPPQQRPAVQQQQSAQQQQPVNQTAQQQQVVSEIEGASSGLPSNDGPVEEAPSELTPEQMAEIAMREEVTETVRIMISEGVTKPNVRSWVEYAYDKWPKHLLIKLGMMTSERERWPLISSLCAREVWVQFGTLLNSQIQSGDASEQVLAHNELNRLMDMCAEMVNQARLAQRAQQLQQNQPVQQPPQQQQQPVNTSAQPAPGA